MCQSINTKAIRILGIGGGNFPHGILSGRNRLGAERKYAQCIGQNLARLRIVIDNQGADTRQIRDEAFLFLSCIQCRTRH